ncbi:alpha/beta hydrolase [Pseudonocardia acaciae]|uniref:alpha/beta hydrolase n=1 Tax=Pseudonocardia acaciae TaxID=551276 RepID=UPI000688B83C|nr:alpha/beta hydrolase-fold protein [Pseudonocardia acaciae]
MVSFEVPPVDGGPDPPPSGPWDLSLLTGSLPLAISLAGLVGAVYLMARRDRSWWLRLAPALLAGATALTGLTALVINSWWRPLPDELPARVFAWVGVALLGVAFAVAGWPGQRWWRRGLAVLAALLVLATAGIKVNAFYGYYPRLRDVIGLPAANEISFSALATGPATMPDTGRVTHASIPGAVSGFVARPASIYLPPGYLVGERRPALPVLVLIPGQPGLPYDWFTAGRLATVMDRYAAEHRGLAPVVVVPDATGSLFGNPLCLDSNLGNSETYLARDVPDWIVRNLRVDTDRRHWAIGGFSYGGTCALQLGVRAPATYPTFVAISGQDEPSLGDHAQTVAAAFGGDEARFQAVNPANLLATGRFPNSLAVIAIGAQDGDYLAGARRVAASARAAGMQVRYLEPPGGHSWTVAVAALGAALPLITPALGLGEK